MVEINNQRKAFDMLAWSEELITDVRKPEIMVMTRHCGGELFTDYLITRKLVTLNPKLKSTGAGRSASFPLVDVTSKAPERLLSEKSGRCGIAAD